MIPAACCITLRVFPVTVWSLPINGSLNTNGLVIAEVYKPGQIGILYTLCTQQAKWAQRPTNSNVVKSKMKHPSDMPTPSFCGPTRYQLDHGGCGWEEVYTWILSHLLVYLLYEYTYLYLNFFLIIFLYYS